jgi:hypothetical protein
MRQLRKVLVPRTLCHKGFTEVSQSTATRSTHGAATGRGLARSRPSFRSRQSRLHGDLADIQADTRPNDSGNFVTESRYFDLAYTSRARLMSAPTDIE